MREYLFKGVAVTALMVQIALVKNILDYTVSREIYDLNIIGKKLYAVYVMIFCVEKDIVAFISCRRVDLNEMILKRADQNEIPRFQLVFSVLYNVRSITVQKIDQFIRIVRMHRIGVAGKTFRDLMLEKHSIRCPDIIVYHKNLHSAAMAAS